MAKRYGPSAQYRYEHYDPRTGFPPGDLGNSGYSLFQGSWIA